MAHPPPPSQAKRAEERERCRTNLKMLNGERIKLQDRQKMEKRENSESEELTPMLHTTDME
jgi:hypothetical protein